MDAAPQIRPRRSRRWSARPRRRVRWRRRLAVTAILLLVVWLVGGYFVVVRPATDRPAPVDAILVLGPPTVDHRAADALAMAAAGQAHTVVISVPTDSGWQIRKACQVPVPQYTVICFKPNPSTTRGEAEELRRLVDAHGWRSVMVITSTYHISRARLIVGRCTDDRVLMVAASGRPSLGNFAFQYLYQTGGFAKAFLHRAC